jgi:hypothetical protein
MWLFINHRCILVDIFWGCSWRFVSDSILLHLKDWGSAETIRIIDYAKVLEI